GIFSRMAPVEVSPGSGRQVSAGRETPNADSRRIDVPLLGAGAHRANRSLSVLQGRRMMIARGDAILEHKAGHADRVNPFGDLLAFVVDGEKSIAASRTDDHGRPVGLVRRWQINVQGWFVLGLVP